MESIGGLTETVLSPIQAFWAEVVGFVPNLLAAVVLIAVGYLLGRLVRTILEGGLRRLKLDKFGESTGASGMLKNISADLTFSRLLGALGFWFIFLAFFISAADALGLPRFSSAIDAVVSYLPNVVGAIAILLVGLYVARMAHHAIARGARNLGTEYAGTTARAAYWLIAIVTFSLAVGQLNIETVLLNQVVSIVLIGLVVAAALALGLGGRFVAANIIAGIYLRELIQQGQKVSIGDVSGTLAAVTAAKTIVETEGGEQVVLANQQVLDEVMSIRAE